MKALLASTVLAAATTLATAADLPVKMQGGIIVNEAGMTTYTFDKDTAGSGKSACNGPCAQLWPPVMVPAGAQVKEPYSVVTRDDGGKQLAHQGKPLYLYAADKAPGDKTGDNFKDVWHVAK